MIGELSEGARSEGKVRLAAERLRAAIATEEADESEREKIYKIENAVTKRLAEKQLYAEVNNGKTFEDRQ
jgi:hypothetical protein